MNLYGVYFGERGFGRGKWALTRSKAQAVKLARREQGVVLVHRNAYGQGSVSAWDAPTFRVLADGVVADFREAEAAS